MNKSQIKKIKFAHVLKEVQWGFELDPNILQYTAVSNYHELSKFHNIFGYFLLSLQTGKLLVLSYSRFFFIFFTRPDGSG